MKPGLKPTIAGILLLAAAFILAVGMVVQMVRSLQSAPQERFEVPGSVHMHADKAGRYYLWHHHDAVYNGTNFSDETERPDGLEIEVVDDGGNKLMLHDHLSITSSGPTGTKRSIGYVQLNEPTALSVKVSGDIQPAVFSLSRFELFEMLKSFLIGFALTSLFAAVGLGFLICGLIRLFSRSSPADS